MQFRRPHTDLARKFLDDAEQSFWILEFVIEDVQKAYETGFLSRNKEDGTWSFLVPSTPPLGNIQLFNYKVALTVNDIPEISTAGHGPQCCRRQHVEALLGGWIG